MKKLPYNEILTKVLNYPTEEEFAALVKSAKEPFKVTGSMEGWELYKNMISLKNPSDQCNYLATLVRNKHVYFTILPQKQKGVIGLNKKLQENFSFKSKKALFPQFMNEVKNYITKPNLGTLYLQSTPIEELNDKLGSLALFKGFSPMTMPRFWIGSGSQFVSLHNDPYRNIIAVFTGRKRVIMFPPEELPNLYPAPFDKKLGGVIASLVNVFDPDLVKFPLFKKALKRVKVAVINPGEFLYMPPLWWHAVEGEGFNVGLNCWFFDASEKNEFVKLYIPAQSLMLNLNHNIYSNTQKKLLYRCFNQIIEKKFVETELMNKVDPRVIKEAKKIVNIIDNPKLSEDQKKLWRDWVKVFAFHYVFCLQGSPFPTMHKDEFSAMIKRFKNTLIHKTIEDVLHKMVIYVRVFLIKKKKKHGIVPL